MTGTYASAVMVVSLVLSAWAFLLAAMNRPRSMSLLIGTAVLEVMLIVFAIGGIVQMSGSDHDFARLEFVGYLIACAAVLPAAVAWSWGETSRAAAVVIGITLLVMPVLLLRVQQVWAGPVA
jgi:hypothetical protein